MRPKLREKVSCYLPKELAAHYRQRASQEGMSVSAYLVRKLAIEEQIDDLQQWMSSRFDRADDIGAAILQRLDQAGLVDRLLALVGLDRIEPELLAGSLSRVKEQFPSLTAKQREQLIAKGKELLGHTNGAHK